MAKNKTNTVEKSVNAPKKSVDTGATTQPKEKVVVAAPTVVRTTSRSIAKVIFKTNLVLRGIYHGHTAFALPEGEGIKHDVVAAPDGLFESYTHFRQTTRDMIIAATGCSAASARTMFIHCKNVTIEKVRAESSITIQVNGKDLVLDEAKLSLVRDMKPKKEKVAKEDVVEDTSATNENNRWLIIDAANVIVATAVSKAKAKEAATEEQSVKDRTKWTAPVADESKADESSEQAASEQASDEPTADDIAKADEEAEASTEA